MRGSIDRYTAIPVRRTSLWMKFTPDSTWTGRKDFKGWSLSVGDIILLHQRDGSHAYFVDSIGFEEIPGFSMRHDLEASLAQETLERPEAMIITLRGASREEQGFAYTQEDAILAASGAIGHLRAEMGQDGEGFHADWTGHAGQRASRRL